MLQLFQVNDYPPQRIEINPRKITPLTYKAKDYVSLYPNDFKIIK